MVYLGSEIKLQKQLDSQRREDLKYRHSAIIVYKKGGGGGVRRERGSVFQLSCSNVCLTIE